MDPDTNNERILNQIEDNLAFMKKHSTETHHTVDNLYEEYHVCQNLYQRSNVIQFIKHTSKFKNLSSLDNEIDHMIETIDNRLHNMPEYYQDFLNKLDDKEHKHDMVVLNIKHRVDQTIKELKVLLNQCKECKIILANKLKKEQEEKEINRNNNGSWEWKKKLILMLIIIPILIIYNYYYNMDNKNHQSKESINN